MAKIKSFEEFVSECGTEKPKYVKRFKELVEHNLAKMEPKHYAVQISLDAKDSIITLLEHQKLQQFNSTRNRFVFHPAQEHIPVKAHYHVYPPNGTTKELYAVNMDGTAHHKRNRGLEIPSKEADEFRAMGVQVNASNILEMIELPANDVNQLLLESIQGETVSFFLIFEE